MINFDNSYSKLPNIFFERINPVAVKKPSLIQFNKPLAKEIGLNLEKNEKKIAEK